MFEIIEHYETLEEFKRHSKRGISVVNFGDESISVKKFTITLANYILYKFHKKDENGYKVSVEIVQEISKDELFVLLVYLGYYVSKDDKDNIRSYIDKIEQFGKIDTLRYTSDITLLKGITKFERLDLEALLCQKD